MVAPGLVEVMLNGRPPSEPDGGQEPLQSAAEVARRGVAIAGQPSPPPVRDGGPGELPTVLWSDSGGVTCCLPTWYTRGALRL